MTSTRRAGMATVLVSVLALIGVLGSAPASADPSYDNLPTNTLSPQYNVGGCHFKVRYGNFSSTAYSQVRIYNPTSCGNPGMALGYNDGTTERALTKQFSDGYTTGTDSCGAYRELAIAAPGVNYATYVLVSMPGSGFSGWRVFSADGQSTEPIYSNC